MCPVGGHCYLHPTHTSQQFGGFTDTVGTSLSGLTVVASVLLAIGSSILCCCLAARKGAAVVRSIDGHVC
jgi:citrate lyase gamma subunit